MSRMLFVLLIGYGQKKKIPTLKDFVELEIRMPLMTVLLCLGHIKT